MVTLHKYNQRELQECKKKNIEKTRKFAKLAVLSQINNTHFADQEMNAGDTGIQTR